MTRPAIFLDRDGTIIVDRNYLGDPVGVKLEKGAVGGLRRLSDLGYELVVVSNQSGIGRGYFDAAAVDAVNTRVDNLLEEHGIAILGWYYCPHTDGDNCLCRKPQPGLIERASRDHNLDICQSYVIGDKKSDVLLGDVVGATGILLTSGQGLVDLAWAQEEGRPVFGDLSEAAEWISRTPRRVG